jgi:hypothetical protein
MRKISNLFIVVVLCTITAALTSAIPASKTPVTPEKATVALAALEKAGTDGKITNKELRKIATDFKGEKLTLKERIGLKVFGKKIADKLDSSSPAAEGGKSQLTAAILCFFLGALGIHRFYLGYTWQGVVQLLTLGGCGVWALIDFIRILMGTLQPKNGPYEKTLND